MTEADRISKLRHDLSNPLSALLAETQLLLLNEAQIDPETVAGLPEVFNPRKRPWVAMHAAPTDELIETVMKCPSGALSFERLT